MIRRALLLVPLLFLCGCDIDFVDVRERQHVLLVVKSQDDGEMTAEVLLDLMGFDSAPSISLDGGAARVVPREAAFRWALDTAFIVTSRPPVVRVGIDGLEEIVAPLVMSAGTAAWTPEGDLSFPLVVARPRFGFERWRIELADPSGPAKLSLDVVNGQLPSQIVLAGGLIPEGAEQATLRVSSGETFDRGYPVAVGTEVLVVFGIPPR